MSTLLLVHRGEVAVERDAVAGLAASMRGMGHDVRCTWEQRGIAGGQLEMLETAVAAVDSVLIVDPSIWWANGADEWQRSLLRLVEYAVWAGVDRFAVVLGVWRTAAELSEPLERLQSFRLPEDWSGLGEWLARPRAEFVLRTEERVGRETAPLQVIESALATIDKTAARGDLVWIRGAAGTGKSTLLAEWLRRRADRDATPICHVARPGIAWSHDPEQVWGKLVRALLGADFVGSPADALARLDERRPQRAIVVLDGLEQIVSRLVEGERRQRLQGWFASRIPRGVTVVATSRALGPGFSRTPTIDLDAEPWRTRQRMLQANTERAKMDDVSGELSLPAEVASSLERSWTAMLARVGRRRSLLRSALAVVVAARESLPISLLNAALSEDERALLLSEASEWLREEGGRVGFVHPFVRVYLEPELDALDPAPHVRLLDAFASLKSRNALDAACTTYLDRYGREHRLACHGFDAALAWVLDVEALVSLAANGRLVARLQAALDLADPERRVLIEHQLAVARRRCSEFVEHPDALASHLWNELVAAGKTPAEVLELLHWGALLPPIRLHNAMRYRERSYLRLGHGSDVRGCAIDAEATRAISVTTDHHLHIWSVRTGEQLAKLDIDAWAEGCAISADGTRGAVGAGRRVSLWNLDEKTRIGHHEEHDDDVTAVSMSADGRRVVSTDRAGSVRLWQIEPNRVWLLGRHDAVVRCCAISGDGRLAMTGDDDRRAMVWDLERRERLHTLAGHTYGVGSVALTWTGDVGVSICIGEARIWEPRSGKLLHKHGELGMNSHGCVLVEERVGEGREVLVAESGQELHRWTVAKGELRVRHFAHAQDMTCVASTRDGKWYMTGGQDHVARVWQSASIGGIDEYPHARAITALRASADKTSVWVSGGGDGTRCVSIVDGRERSRLSPDGAHAIAEAGDHIVTVGSNRQVAVHSRSRASHLESWEPTSDWLRACAIDPTHTRVAYAGDEKIVFCSDFEGKDIVRLTGHGDWIRALDWTADGRLVSVDDDGELRVWNVDAESCVLECDPLDDIAIYALALAGDRAFVGGVGGKIASVDLRNGKTLGTFEGHPEAITDLAMAGQNTLVSVGRDATLRIWAVDYAKGRLVARYDGIFPFTRVAVVDRTIVAGDAAGNYLILSVDWDRLQGA